MRGSQCCDWMADSVDPDQSISSGVTWSGSTLFVQAGPYILGKYS